MSENEKIAHVVGVSEQVDVPIIFDSSVVKKPLDHWIVDLVNAVQDLLITTITQQAEIDSLRQELRNHNHYEQ